jgi:hypothetical protein
MKNIIIIALALASIGCFAQDETKEERKANRERVKADQKLLNEQARNDKHELPEPDNPAAYILRRLPTQDVPALQNAEPAKLYDIKGDHLGMTLEEFAKKHYYYVAPIPKQKYRGFIGPDCEDRDQPSLFLSAQEASVGVIACAAERSNWSGPQSTLANVPLQGIGYKFFKGHLFSIMAVFGSDNYAAMKASFTETFGAPASSNSHEVQNRMGAKFDDDTTVWSNGLSMIEMRQRQSDLNTSFLIVYLPKVQEEVEALLPKPKKDL